MPDAVATKDTFEAAGAVSRASLPREVNEFLVDLSVALHKHAMYPLGHPSLGPAAEGVTRQAERLMAGNEVLAFGVARHQLIIEGVATDPNQPVLRRLAESLHRHHLGAISLLRGLHADEVAAMLRALAVDKDGPGQAPASVSQLPQVPHIKLHPLTFDGLTIGADVDPEESASSASRSAILWVGLAQAAMAGEDPANEGATPEPSRVADAIERHHGAEAYDQVVVGYLLQIAGELKNTTGADAEALRRRTARLISALRPETLRRLLTMGGHSTQRNAFLLDATHGMAVDAVIDIVKAAADASNQTISHGLVRMLTKLSTQAETGHESQRPAADSALREQVQSLLSEWQLADPNPEDYRHMLQYLATSSTPRENHAESGEQLNALRLVQMSLEVGSWGPIVDRSISACLKRGGAPALVSVLEKAPEGSTVVEHLRASLTQPMAIGAIASQEPLDESTLDSLMPWVTADGYATLLDVLASSQSRVTRRKLLDRLSRTPLDVIDLVSGRLQDGRWYVQRNMLLLLTRLGRVTEGFQIAPWVGHIDPRVRVEAVRLQMDVLGQREAALRTALKDPDPRVVRVGIAAAQQDCPVRVLPFLVEAAVSARLPEDLRLLAVQALGRSHERVALDGLLPLVDGGKTMFGRRRLLPKSPLLVAALRALSGAWRSESTASALLALAAASPDEDVRGAVK